MKKAGLLFFSVVVTLVTLSCLSSLGTVWDDSVPPGESAKIAFVFFEPASYNQIAVNKKDFRVVTVPAGAAEFAGELVYTTVAGNLMQEFHAKGAVFSCVLEAGKEYWAWGGYTDNEEETVRTWGIRFYEDKIKGLGPGKGTLVGFIPFDPPITSR
ncbi:MAG: hypothetical protein LBI67_02790 [Treponema sp.]|jgi:hypothetical protein|nr:hypothetical protein [Treponema sp.]